MKFKLILIGVALIGLTFTGCEKVKSLLDVHFDTQFTANMNVSVPAGSLSDKSIAATFSGSATINPKDDADVAKYGDLIKSFDISKATGTFNNVSKDFTLVNADLTITSGSKSASWHFNNVTITNGSEISLDNTDGQWDTVNAILGSLDPFTVSISGETDTDDINFTVSVTLNATVTANPLNLK